MLGGIPTLATDYSPLWDVNVGEWTETAIDQGFRSRLTDEFQILGFVLNGFVTGPRGAPYGSVGAFVNCPIVFRFLFSTFDNLKSEVEKVFSRFVKFNELAAAASSKLTK